MKTVIILALLALLVFVSDRLVRVESQRAALRSGLCPSPVAELNLPDGSCLFKARPAVSWLGYLSAAVRSAGPAVSFYAAD